MFSEWLRRHVIAHSTSVCHLCGLTIVPPAGETIWCNHCLQLFTERPRCLRCGLETLSVTSTCGSCLAKPPPWDRLICAGSYTKPLSVYVHGLKSSGHIQFAWDLAYLLSKRITDPAPLITCVPLHWSRYLYRGYNQSAVLGYYLKQHLGNATTFDNRVFRRTKPTPSQQGLDKKRRAINLRGAFGLNFSPNQSHIAILDDVVTTGSTVRQLCRLLLGTGIEKIDIYCICRTGT